MKTSFYEFKELEDLEAIEPIAEFPFDIVKVGAVKL